jgi:hypothetical protein
MCEEKGIIRINSETLSDMRNYNYSLLILLIESYRMKVVDMKGNFLSDLVNDNGEIKTLTFPKICDIK